MDLILCACQDQLTPHDYVQDKLSMEDGYLCKKCRTFKALDDEGNVDVHAYYQRMKSEKEEQTKKGSL